MSNVSTAKGPSVLQTVRPILVLVLTCLVAGGLLGVVHDVTAPIAEANEQEKAQATYAALRPDAASFEPVEAQVDGCTAALVALDGSGETLGYVVVAESKGYGGKVPIAVAFAPDGRVVGTTAMANDETPGLGTRIADDAYIGQYVGRTADALTADDVDLISGATISSKAALAAFNIAVEAFREVS